MKHRNHSISHKMTLIIIGVSSFFAVLTMLVQLIWNYQDSIDNATSDIREYSESILPSVAKSLWDVDRSLLSDLLSGLGMMPLVSSVHLDSIDGVTMHLGKPLLTDDESQTLFHYPVTYQEQSIATLTVGLDTNRLYYELWRQLIFIVLGNGLKTLLMIYLILTLVRLMVTDRLSALEDFTNKINLNSLKKLSVPETVTARPDEIAHVALSLKDMYQRIRNDLAINKRQQRALQQQQHLLSDLVKERTKELDWQSQSNQLLAEISLQFLSIDTCNVDKTLTEVCHKIGQLFDVERVSLLEFHQQHAYYRSFWTSDLHANKVQVISVDNIAQLAKKFETESTLVIEDLEALKAFSPQEYEVMKSVGICSIAAFAIKNAGELLGLLSLSTVSRPLNWNAQKKNMLTQFATALNELLLREQKERQMIVLQQALVAANSQLKVMAETDELTGLANRRPFTERLATVLQANTPAGLLMLDIDYFKSYNDTYGHLEGDTVLKRVADALAQCDILPHNALLARIGGEEFALVVEQVTPAQLTAIATQLCYLVEQLNIPHQVSPLAVVTISIGSVFLPLDKISGFKMADVLRRADVCLYRAKDKGRNRVEVEVI